ncbi:hypothetical protein [Mesorhizobium sp. CN2-181]|uniref:hypothetical protein n=1 Tax=Mesorhizobium yinganensis TaxID=3157707 RepID=UPI0032B763A0
MAQAVMLKLQPAGQLPLILTSRGDMGVLAHFGQGLMAASAAGSVDGALDQFNAFLRSEMAANRNWPKEQDLFIAGFSETRGAFHWHAEIDAGAKWRTDLPDFVAGIPLDDSEVAATGIDIDAEAAFVPSTLRLFEACRSKPVFHGGPALGGQVVLTTITADGFKAEVIAYWLDLLGKVPSPSEPLRRIGAVGGPMMMGVAA